MTDCKSGRDSGAAGRLPRPRRALRRRRRLQEGRTRRTRLHVRQDRPQSQFQMVRQTQRRQPLRRSLTTLKILPFNPIQFNPIHLMQFKHQSTPGAGLLSLKCLFKCLESMLIAEIK